MMDTLSKILSLAGNGQTTNYPRQPCNDNEIVAFMLFERRRNNG